MSPISISVVIPTHNHAAYVGEAIASVLHQSCVVDEIIVVDDGSTDDTRARMNAFGTEIRYIHQENRGLSSARNTGLRAARHAWVAFLDSDDWWHEDKIRHQVTALAASPEAVLAYPSMTVVSADGTRLAIPAVPANRIWPALRYRNCITGSGSGVLIRRDALMEAGGFDENLPACEDWDLWVRLALKHKFVAAPDAVTFIRRLSGSMSTNHSRMLGSIEQIIEPTLLDGLSGLSRKCWARRIRGAAYYRAASDCAMDGPEQKSYLVRSLAQWPFPDLLPERWLLAARLSLGKSLYNNVKRPFRRRAALQNYSGNQV